MGGGGEVRLLTEAEVRERIRAAAASAGSVSALARRLKIRSPYIFACLAGRERVTGKLAKLVGVETELVYRDRSAA